MAKTHRLTRFAKPRVLRSIDSNLLVELLRSHSKWFEEHGVCLAQPGKLDYDALSLAFIGALADIPPSLLELVCLIDDMSADRFHDDLRRLAAQLHVSVSGNATTADIAVLLALHHLDALADLHMEGVSYRFRTTDRIAAICDGIPRPQKFTPDVKDHLEDTLNADFERRGRERTANVFPFDAADGLRLLISRGGTMKRQGVIEHGQRHTRLFRPEEFDLVCYDQKRGDLLVNVKGVTDLRVYCQAIGLCLFGERFLFAPELSPRRYSLAPFRERGRAALTFAHIPGIEDAWLHRLDVRRRDFDGGRIQVEGAHVWEMLELFGNPVPDAAVYFRAAIKFKLKGLRRERMLKITPPYRCECEQDDYGELIGRFMDEGGYLLPRAESLCEIPPTLFDLD